MLLLKRTAGDKHHPLARLRLHSATSTFLLAAWTQSRKEAQELIASFTGSHQSMSSLSPVSGRPGQSRSSIRYCSIGPSA